MDSADDEGKLSIANLQDRAQAIVTEVERSIVGKTETVRRAVLCLLCNGHLLLEDIPGVGKTTLAKALAQTMHLGLERGHGLPEFCGQVLI